MHRISVLRATAIVLCVCCAAWAQAPADASSVILTVDGTPVSAGEVRLAMQSVAAQLQRAGQQVDEQQLFQAATEQVVSVRLLAQEARRRDLAIAASDIDTIMAQIDQQSGGRDAVTASLASSGITYDMLRTAVEESELAERLINAAVRPGVEVSDEEVHAFYSENPQMFQVPEQVRARHILFKVEEGAGDDEVGQARTRAEQARERALAGEDFADLARELSEGPSADQGGDLGFFSASQMVQPFSDVAFALEPGQISEVVRTSFGWHVIKVEERRAAGARQLDEVREPLRSALLERKVNAGVAQLVASLREAAEIVPSQTPSATGTDGDAG